MRQLVIASHNPGKLRELRRLLGGLDLELLAPGEAGCLTAPEERDDGYDANAIAKARAVTDATGLPALGEDSGIEVLALGGWPGPRSARWQGEDAADADRLRGLIEEVERRCPDDPRVRYVAAVALTRPGEPPVLAHGHCDGRLVRPSGTGGFGYDPGFWCDDLGRRFGEATPEEKDSCSHRARAIAALVATGALVERGAAVDLRAGVPEVDRR